MSRVFELWVGAQMSGKTYQVKRRILALAKRPTIASVLVADRLGEYGDCGTVYRSREELGNDCRETLPRVAVCQFGIGVEAYEVLYQLAEYEGHCVLVLDEARQVAPPGAAWRGSPRLERIALAGRHLPNRAGKLCETHLIVALQHPKGLHVTIREQASTVMVGQLHGGNALRWVSEEFGPSVQKRVEQLGEHQWLCAQGKDPR